MARVNAYLNFKGNCEAAFNFYRSVFGGEFAMVGRFKDMPPAEGQTMDPAMGEQIMHISLPISKETILMGSDTGGEWAANFKPGNNIQLSVDTDSEEEARRIFVALAAGGQVTMPIDKTFWGALFGMLIDSFGITWMVNYDYKPE
jgi:PhnB protein